MQLAANLEFGVRNDLSPFKALTVVGIDATFDQGSTCVLVEKRAAGVRQLKAKL